MEESGLIKAEWEDNAERTRGPRRRIYRLSPKGKKKLAKSREQFQEFVQVIGGILGATT
jgi:PadR family transcriptional regulator PadR